MADIDETYLTKDVAKELGISPRRVRQLSVSLGLGLVLPGLLLFTPAEVEQMRQRRTDRTPIRCWLRERAKQLPQREELDKT